MRQVPCTVRINVPILTEKIVQEINRLDDQYVLETPQAELEKQYIEKIFIRPLVLHTDSKYIIKGTLDLAIPYEGNPMLWKLRPSRFTLSSYPDIKISADRIVFGIGSANDRLDQARLRETVNEAVRSLANGVQELKPDVEKHNRDAPQRIKEAIKQKRQKAQANADAVSGLGIPIKDK
jgi:hypothetical protein